MIAYLLAKFGEVGCTHPGESFVTLAPPPKIARRKRAKWSTTQPWIIIFIFIRQQENRLKVSANIHITCR